MLRIPLFFHEHFKKESNEVRTVLYKGVYVKKHNSGGVAFKRHVEIFLVTVHCLIKSQILIYYYCWFGQKINSKIWNIKQQINK